ncbi:MAG TPA: GNAT family N-acetyltransferase [Mycobacteriales bacterium]|nr:GNAT family N-acetyltransferase [Mycobacteriales bacterium]
MTAVLASGLERAVASIRPLEPGQARGLVGELAVLAAAVFAGPPWCEPPAVSAELVAARLQVDSRSAGFGCVVAEAGGELVGFAWRRTAWALATLGGRPACGQPPVELRELAVHPRWHGHRIGAGLHDALLAGSTSPAWLVTHPAAQAALGLYRRRGWQVVRLLSYPPTKTRLLMHKRR